MEHELTVVRQFLTRVDADLAAGALAAAGIQAMVRSDDCGGLRPHLWMGGVDVLVAEDDAARAVEVLDSVSRRPARRADEA